MEYGGRQLAIKHLQITDIGDVAGTPVVHTHLFAGSSGQSEQVHARGNLGAVAVKPV
jgi:hypothetical protein